MIRRPPENAIHRQWETTLAPLIAAGDHTLWRAHSDATNVDLFERWLPEGRCEDALKTDCYDEAMGEGLARLLAARAARVTALDVAHGVAGVARARHPILRTVVGDVRRLPFRDAVFDVVVSNSTLDHFERRVDIDRALAELLRTLKPGGILLVTLDNLRHPAVALRNILPFRLLRFARLVDYPSGATHGPKGLSRALRSAGFEVLESATLLHCPRAWAVARARALQRSGSLDARRRFLTRLARWERLAEWPTHRWTGHYVAVRARKPAARP